MQPSIFFVFPLAATAGDVPSHPFVSFPGPAAGPFANWPQSPSKQRPTNSKQTAMILGESSIPECGARRSTRVPGRLPERFRVWYETKMPPPFIPSILIYTDPTGKKCTKKRGGGLHRLQLGGFHPNSILVLGHYREVTSNLHFVIP